MLAVHDLKGILNYLLVFFYLSSQSFLTWGVFCLLDKRITSPLFRAITLKYSKYFNFGVVRKPSKEITRNFQIKQLPTILVMIAAEGKHEGNKILKFSSVFYESKLYGEISYVNLTRFFYAVHEKHWAEHPDAKKYKGKLGLREFFADDVRKVLTKDSEAFSPEDKDDAIEEEWEKRKT